MLLRYVLLKGRRLYWLNDKFATLVSAGNVNGTFAQPIGGKRTITDTENKLSITGG